MLSKCVRTSWVDSEDLAGTPTRVCSRFNCKRNSGGGTDNRNRYRLCYAAQLRVEMMPEATHCTVIPLYIPMLVYKFTKISICN